MHQDPLLGCFIYHIILLLLLSSGSSNTHHLSVKYLLICAEMWTCLNTPHPPNPHPPTPHPTHPPPQVPHYNDVIMGTITSQITSLTIIYSTVYSDADQRKHQSSASLAFVWGIHRGPVNSPHKWPVTRKMFPFDDVIMSPIYTGHKLSHNCVCRWPNTKLCWVISRHNANDKCTPIFCSKFFWILAIP